MKEKSIIKMEVTDRQFAAMKVPMPGWVLVKKDMLPSKTDSGIHIEQNTRWYSTGIVVAKSFATFGENEFHEKLYNLIKVGDRIGVNPTNPIPAPIPHFFYLKDDEFGNKPEFIYIHIQDVLELITLTKESLEELHQRCGKD
jgi:co-chaperonin GroES (HSP10)